MFYSVLVIILYLSNICVAESMFAQQVPLTTIKWTRPRASKQLHSSLSAFSASIAKSFDWSRSIPVKCVFRQKHVCAAGTLNMPQIKNNHRIRMRGLRQFHFSVYTFHAPITVTFENGRSGLRACEVLSAWNCRKRLNRGWGLSWKYINRSKY